MVLFILGFDIVNISVGEEVIMAVSYNKLWKLMIDKNIIENNNLTKQRDELLPLLMNGQVLVNSDLSLG